MATIFRHRYDLDRDHKLFEALKLVSHESGPYIQIQNDFLDYTGGENVLYKPEHDIKNGRFSWCATTAMTIGTEQQKDVLRKCYGKNGEKGGNG